jgi:hypothetical protein
MRIEEATSAQREQWDAYVMAHPDSVAWHMWAWSEVVRKHYDVQFIPLMAQEGETLRGVLPLSCVSPNSSKPRLLSVPYAVAGGILSDTPEVEAALLSRAIEIRQEMRAPNITFKQYKHRILGDLTTDENYYNRELDLTTPTETLWQNLAPVNREKIEEARRNNPQLEYPASDVDAYYRLLLRQHTRLGVPCVSRGWIRDLIGSGLYSLALLRQDRNLVAATLIKEYRDTISLPFSCVASDSPAMAGYPYYLYWELMRHFARKGTRICHSGRIPRGESTESYRLGWGGIPHPYFYQYHPPTGVKTEFQKKRGRKRQILAACWRCLPDALAERLGPIIVRQFP